MKKKISDHTWIKVLDDGRAFTLSNKRDSGLDTILWQAQERNWEYMPATVCGQKIIPYGSDNMLPSRLRDVLDGNNLGPGILERQMGLLFGQGVYLSRLAFEDGRILHNGWKTKRYNHGWKTGITSLISRAA